MTCCVLLEPRTVLPAVYFPGTLGFLAFVKVCLTNCIACCVLPRYPWLIYVFYQSWQQETQERGTPWNPFLVAPVFQACLTGE